MTIRGSIIICMNKCNYFLSYIVAIDTKILRSLINFDFNLYYYIKIKQFNCLLALTKKATKSISTTLSFDKCSDEKEGYNRIILA